MTSLVDDLRPVDPLTDSPGGCYSDAVVVVRRAVMPAEQARIATKHFRLDRSDGKLRLTHNLVAGRIDNDLAGLLADELFAAGWLSGSDVFERLFTGVVLSSADHPLDAWELFYRNTLRRLEFLHHTGTASARHGSLSDFAPVYAEVLPLVGFDTVLELGCCFGFLSLLMAERGATVTATDLSAGTVRLLSALATRLGIELDTLACDAARVPMPDRSHDVVTVIHLLEHLDTGHAAAVVAEAVRLARHRVIVAVPYEDEPTAAFGHVRIVTEADLLALADQHPDWQSRCFDSHGGWLILDRR